MENDIEDYLSYFDRAATGFVGCTAGWSPVAKCYYTNLASMSLGIMKR